MADKVWPMPEYRRRSRELRLIKFSTFLLQNSGRTWQERWDASDLHTGALSVVDAAGDNKTRREQFNLAVRALLLLRVVQPTVTAFRANRFAHYPETFVPAQRDPALERYVAVFEEDVTRHYQAHLQRRGATRPDDEYKPVNDLEWAEFEEHFDKRKVELGGCGRPYATPCSHEHACIRCPMLQVDPKMIARLDDIESDLQQRRQP